MPDALLQRLGTSGATTLSASLAVIARGAFLCNAVLTSRVSVEDQPGALAIGLFPSGSCMAQLVKGLEMTDSRLLASARRARCASMPGTSPSPSSARTLWR